MKKININTKTSQYDILLGENILSNLNNYLKKYDKILILSNEHIGNLYFEKVCSTLLSKDNVYFFTIPDGEEFKNIQSVMSIYDFIIDKEFSRKSLIISLGGGVICDIGGYVAASFMRGIDFIQVPTSLLAQVDASIGGKTAIDHPKGKNLIGAFKQPKLVLIDVEFLKTLPKEQFSSGMGEIIKHSLIVYHKDNSYYDFLQNNSEKILKLDFPTIINMVEKSCKIKKYFVEEDEDEKGIRALLNFGHTYGHALEKLFSFKNITHGEAISKGIIFELMLSKKTSNIDDSLIEEIISLFKKYGINPYPIYYNEKTLISSLKKDKKNSFGKINFILPNANLELEQVAIDTPLILETIKIFKNRFIKGIIDIGTNSCRLFLAQVFQNDNNIVIEKEIIKLVEIVKLGEDVNKNHYLKESAINRTVSCLRNYKNIADNYGALTLTAFATSATRDSSNKDIFLNQVKELGIDIKCISGNTEATLNFLGNSIVFNSSILVVDIGGGSTEFTLGKNKDISYLHSFNIGAVRATELFFKDENYSKENIDKCINWVKDKILSLKELSLENVKLVGVAGTVTTQVSVIEKMQVYNPAKVHLYKLKLKDIENNLRKFLENNLEERKNIPGLESKRADVIIAGTIILVTIMKFLNYDEITVSESDNLNGAMIMEEISDEQ